MLHTTIAHCLLSDAQPVLEQQSAPPGLLLPLYIVSMIFYGLEYPFGPLRSAILAMLTPSFLCWQSTGNWKVLGLE